jgi:hypothetical protein
MGVVSSHGRAAPAGLANSLQPPATPSADYVLQRWDEPSDIPDELCLHKVGSSPDTSVGRTPRRSAPP